MSVLSRDLAAKVSYHPYLAFLAFFDHAKVLRHDAAPPPSVADNSATADKDPFFVENAMRFADHCTELRRDLEAAAKRFPSGQDSEEFAHYLYRPLTLAAFGHSDDFGIALIDSFVAASRLMAVVEGIEDSDVMLCPCINSIPEAANSVASELSELLNAAGHSGHLRSWPFCEPHDLFAQAVLNTGGSGSETATNPPYNAPLCVATDLKVNILASLPHGLQLQQSLYTMLLSLVHSTCVKLLKASTSASDIYSPADVVSLRCIVLEPQGAEDVTLLIFGSNYSVANAIITAIRSATLANMYAADPSTVGRAFTYSALHVLTAQQRSPGLLASPPSESATIGEILDVIGGNHVFMRSYSTLSFSHQLLEETSTIRVAGICEAQLYFDTSPGHEGEIASYFDKATNATWPDAIGGVPTEQCEWLARNSEPALPGFHDVTAILQPGTPMAAGKKAFIYVRDVFRFLANFYSEIRLRDRLAGTEGLNTSETGFMDLTTSLTIRIPSGLSTGVKWNNHRYGIEFFYHLRQKVAHKLRIANLLELRQSLREMGCPSSLQYSILYLYHEFMECIGDPLRCEAVVDLYDPLAMLRSVLDHEGELHQSLINATPAWGLRSKQSLFFTGSTFKSFIDALQNAFTLRIQRSVPNHELRDTAFTLRAGAGKLLAAMDVPLKCSFGMLRRKWGTPQDQDSPAFRHRFGAITTVNTQQNTSISFGVLPDVPAAGEINAAHNRYYYMAINMDMFHLFRPEQAYYFLHEAGHLYFCCEPTLAPVQDWLCLSVDAANEAGRRNAESRTSEVFADLVGLLFIFGNDANLFGRFHGIGFSELTGRVVKVAPESTELHYQFAMIEAFFRGFLVAHFIESLDAYHRSQPVFTWPAKHPVYHSGNKPDADIVYAQLLVYAKEVGPFYRDLPQFWATDDTDSDPRIKHHCRAMVDDVCRESNVAVMERLWVAALDVYKCHLASVADGLDGQNIADVAASINDTFAECLARGNGWCRTLWSDRMVGKGRNDGLDPLFVTSRVVEMYIRTLVGQINSGDTLFVERLDKDTASPSASDPERKYSPYLIEESHLPLHAVHPLARRTKLLAQIACMKTMWDMSTQLRTRRLIEITES